MLHNVSEIKANTLFELQQVCGPTMQSQQTPNIKEAETRYYSHRTAEIRRACHVNPFIHHHQCLFSLPEALSGKCIKCNSLGLTCGKPQQYLAYQMRCQACVARPPVAAGALSGWADCAQKPQQTCCAQQSEPAGSLRQLC